MSRRPANNGGTFCASGFSMRWDNNCWAIKYNSGLLNENNNKPRCESNGQRTMHLGEIMLVNWAIYAWALAPPAGGNGSVHRIHYDTIYENMRQPTHQTWSNLEDFVNFSGQMPLNV